MSVREDWGMICPKCKRGSRLQVKIAAWANLDEGGTCVDEDHEWGDDSECHCRHCYWSGTVKDAKAACNADTADKESSV